MRVSCSFLSAPSALAPLLLLFLAWPLAARGSVLCAEQEGKGRTRRPPPTDAHP
jgi:hypothetical protein